MNAMSSMCKAPVVEVDAPLLEDAGGGVADLQVLGLWLLCWCPLLTTVCGVLLSPSCSIGWSFLLAFTLPLDASDILQLLLLLWRHSLMPLCLGELLPAIWSTMAPRSAGHDQTTCIDIDMGGKSHLCYLPRAF